MVGKSEIKSPPPNRGNEEKEDKNVKIVKPDERENAMRGQSQRNNRGGPEQSPHTHVGNDRGHERGGSDGGHRGGRGGHRGGRGGHGGPPSGPRGDSHGGGPRGGRERGDRPQYGADQPQVSLEDAMPPSDKKFTGRCRLFIGNMPAETTEDEFKAMFAEHGEFTEVFLNSGRGFGFIRMDFRKSAESAKAALDGLVKKGRTLRVRFATHGAALKVKYLTQYVTNEVLAQAFSIFGELERAVVIVDDRGKPTGEGIVEFARKPGAQSALKRISEGVFMLGSSPRPVTVEPLEQKDEEDGYQEKFVQKCNELQREREQTPRFAPHGSFEFDFGNKWKELYTMHEEQQRNLKRQFEEAVAKLEIEQAGAMMEHQTNMLRQDLLRRQEELRRLEELHQMELQKRMERVNRGFDGNMSQPGGNPFRRQDEERRLPDDERRRQEMDMRRQQQEERRQQELFAQQERAMREMRGERGGEHGGHGNAPPMQPPPAPPAGMGIERGGGRQGGKGGMGGGHGGMGGQQGSHEGGGNFGGEQPQQLRQSRFDQPPGFANQGHGGMASGNHENENMGGGMGSNHSGNMMGMGHSGRGNSSGGGGGGGGGGGQMNEQQERMMQERQMQERQMQERQMQERQVQERQVRGGSGGAGADRNMREDFFEAKRPRRY